MGRVRICMDFSRCEKIFFVNNSSEGQAFRSDATTTCVHSVFFIRIFYKNIEAQIGEKTRIF